MKNYPPRWLERLRERKLQEMHEAIVQMQMEHEFARWEMDFLRRYEPVTAKLVAN